MHFIANLTNKLSQLYPESKIYLVGGCVRDKLLSRPRIDYDLVVSGVPAKHLEKILQSLGSVKFVGKNFGVYKWRPKSIASINVKTKRQILEIDVALSREEKSYGTGQRRDFKITTNPNLPIEKDLARRDFTINAIAFDVQKKQYIDPFGGRIDLQKKIIRCVGLPETRFREDYSRILRAIRFSAQLGFMIEPKTWRAIKKMMPRLKTVAREIIAAELVKALSWQPNQTTELLEKSGGWKILVPEMNVLKTTRQPKSWHSEGNVWQHTKLALKQIDQKKPLPWPNRPPKLGPFEPHLALAILWHDLGKPSARAKRAGRVTFYEHEKKGAQLAGRIITRLKLASAGINKKWIQWLIQNHMVLFNSDPRKLKNTTVAKYFLNDYYPSPLLLKLIESDDRATIPAVKKTHRPSELGIIKQRIKLLRSRPQKPLLNGDAVMALLNLPPGPAVGQALNFLREAQLAGKIKDEVEARELILRKMSNSKIQMSIQDQMPNNK